MGPSLIQDLVFGVCFPFFFWLPVLFLPFSLRGLGFTGEGSGMRNADHWVLMVPW